ncbi:MAG: hypothetical protein O3B47_00970 [bacterium]|nr:hypothetical protein [bacterium]
MSKRNKNNQLVGGVLAAALVFAVAVGGQLDSSQLSTNAICYGPNWASDAGCTGAEDHTGAACVAPEYKWENGDCFPAGAQPDPNANAGADITCPNGAIIPSGQACTAEQNCVSPNVWNVSSSSCNAPVVDPAPAGATDTCPAATPFKWANGSCYATAETTPGDTPTCPAATPFKWANGSCYATAETTAGTPGATNTSTMTPAQMQAECIKDNNGDGKADGTWNSTTNMCEGMNMYPNTGANTYTQADCQTDGGTWQAGTNGSAGWCQPSNQPDGAAPYCNSTGCEGDDRYDPTNTDAMPYGNYQPNYVDCGQGMWWDDWRQECRSEGDSGYAAEDFEDYRSQCSATETANADPYCYGNHHDGWNSQTGCEASGNRWDQYAWGSAGKGDCFPKDGGFMPMPPMGQKGLFGPATATNTPNWHDLYNAREEGGEALDYCSTIGRGTLECKAGIGSEDDDFFQKIKNNKFDSKSDYGFQATDAVEQLQFEIDQVNIDTGYAYCKGVQSAQEIVDLGPGAFAQLGPDDTRRIFESLHMCRESVWILQELEDMQSRVYGLCETAESTALKVKVDALIEDPSSILEKMKNQKPGGFGQGPLDSLWKEMGKADQACFQHKDQMNACEELNYIASDISMWLEGGDDMPGAPAKTAKTTALAEDALDMVETTLLKVDTLEGKEAKKECRKTLKEMERFEREAFGDDPDFEPSFYDEDDFLARQLGYDDDWMTSQRDLYGDMDDFEAQIDALIAKKLAAFQENLEVMVETTIAKFMDVSSRMIENAVLAAVNDAVSTAVESFKVAFGETKSGNLNAAVSAKMSERVQYYPEEHIQKVEQVHEDILTPLNESLALLPGDVLAEVPNAEGVTERVLTDLVSTAASTEIQSATRKFETALTALTETDADGNTVAKEGKEDALVDKTEAFFEEIEDILNDPEEHDRLVDDGFIPDLADIREISGEWYEEPALAATAALEDRSALVTGTGAGELDPSAPFMIVEVGTILNRMTNDGEENATAVPSGVSMPTWAEGHVGSLIENGTIPKDEVDDFDYYAVAERDEIAYLTVRNMEATHPDFDDIDFGACVLDEETPDVGCDHPYAEEIDKAFKMGLMTGQGDGSWDPYGEFNRAQGFKVTTLADQFLNELDNVGPGAISESVNPELQ